VKFINETSVMGIRLLPPDVNESNFSFTVVGENIRFGLGAVKGVGEGAIESILAGRRASGRFKGMLDFCEKIDLRACNKKVLEALVKSGSMDSFGPIRRGLFDEIERAADQALKAREEKERGQGSLFGGAPVSSIAMEKPVASASDPKLGSDWPDDEKLAFEKETLGFYISGHPLNKFAEELKQFGNASTDTLWQKVDETVNIGGIVGQLKKNKIKKGPNEGKLMAKFVLDDQFGSVDVVVFADMYAKVARWLENGIAVFLTAAVKDTGGVPAGKSASLASAEQHAQYFEDEYGGHPEAGSDLTLGDPTAPPSGENGAKGSDESASLSPARSGADANITPELNCLEIMPLEGIRDAKVKEICVEMPYRDASESAVLQIREIIEGNPGSVPVIVRLTELPEEVAQTESARGNLTIRLSTHFRVTPGQKLAKDLGALHAEVRYNF